MNRQRKSRELLPFILSGFSRTVACAVVSTRWLPKFQKVVAAHCPGLLLLGISAGRLGVVCQTIVLLLIFGHKIVHTHTHKQTMCDAVRVQTVQMNVLRTIANILRSPTLKFAESGVGWRSLPHGVRTAVVLKSDSCGYFTWWVVCACRRQTNCLRKGWTGSIAGVVQNWLHDVRCRGERKFQLWFWVAAKKIFHTILFGKSKFE